MKILFVLNRMAHVRHFDRAIRVLADRGHEVILASQEEDVAVTDVLEHPRIVPTTAPQRREDEWARPASALRRTRDYLRFLHPRYSDAVLLRRRAFEKMAGSVSGRDEAFDPSWAEVMRGMSKPEQKRLDGILAQFETVIPPDPLVDAFLDGHHPDLLVLSPLVGVGFSQADWVKSARRLGIKSGLLVFSWDNLSNKGLLHELPDRVWVWNETQRREAVKLHKVPEDRVVVTGAARFDRFFEMRPAITRQALCELIGFDPSRPILLYLGSSPFVAPRERAFVQQWLTELRASADPALRGCSVIVRPHPAHVKTWYADRRTVVRWPAPAVEKASIARPFDDPHVVVMSSPVQNADQVLWDTIHHSAAVIGLNTSAEIEAAIVGRPVFTILDPSAEGQQGTLHFHYLLREQGGHVAKADDFADHLAQLAAAIHGSYDEAAVSAFLRTFVRPHGLDVPVSPLVADAIAALAA